MLLIMSLLFLEVLPKCPSVKGLVVGLLGSDGTFRSQTWWKEVRLLGCH